MNDATSMNPPKKVYKNGRSPRILGGLRKKQCQAPWYRTRAVPPDIEINTTRYPNLSTKMHPQPDKHRKTHEHDKKSEYGRPLETANVSQFRDPP